MALFCAAIKRNSISLLKYPFRNSVQVFPFVVSPLSRFNYQYSCFCFHYCFSFLLFFYLSLRCYSCTRLLQLIFLSSFSHSQRIHASTQSSMLTRPLFPLRVCLYQLSDITPCTSSSIVCHLAHFSSENSPEYLTRGTAQVFIPLKIFLLQSLVLKSSFILLRNSFLIISFISLVRWCPFLILASTYSFPFLQASKCILDLTVLVLPLSLIFPFSLRA